MSHRAAVETAEYDVQELPEELPWRHSGGTVGLDWRPGREAEEGSALLGWHKSGQGQGLAVVSWTLYLRLPFSFIG